MPHDKEPRDKVVQIYFTHILFCLYIIVLKSTYCTHSTHCNTLQHTAIHCNTMQHDATQRNTTQHNATRSKAVWIYTVLTLLSITQTQHTATYCNTMRRTAAYCNTTHCNILQHTATYCNIRQHIAERTHSTRWHGTPHDSVVETHI